MAFVDFRNVWLAYNDELLAKQQFAVEDISLSDWRQCLAIDLDSHFLTCRSVVPVMKQQRSGSIVNMSSTAAKQVNPEGGVAYTIAKTGVHIMTRMLNQSELRGGIRACVIAPGGVQDPLPGPVAMLRSAAKTIRMARLAVVEREKQPAHMIVHMQPVAHV